MRNGGRLSGLRLGMGAMEWIERSGGETLTADVAEMAVAVRPLSQIVEGL